MPRSSGLNLFRNVDRVSRPIMAILQLLRSRSCPPSSTTLSIVSASGR